jgi:hypothetical protein
MADFAAQQSPNGDYLTNTLLTSSGARKRRFTANHCRILENHKRSTQEYFSLGRGYRPFVVLRLIVDGIIGFSFLSTISRLANIVDRRITTSLDIPVNFLESQLAKTEPIANVVRLRLLWSYLAEPNHKSVSILTM